MIKSFIDKYQKDINVHLIPCREDNYTFVIEKNKEGLLIDSSHYQRVSQYLKENNIKLKAILITHHHYDHVDGIKEISIEHDCKIYCSKIDFNRKAIPEAHQELNEGDELDFLNLKIKVLETPGHTAGHISYYIESLNILFCADTVFSLGCGRVFPDGSLESLFKSLKKISNLKDETIIYCAHEYTTNNFNFLMKNHLSKTSIGESIKTRLKNENRTVPSSIKFEKENNPFLYLKDFIIFKDLRLKKDKF